jgi:hypothetical protein
VHLPDLSRALRCTLLIAAVAVAARQSKGAQAEIDGSLDYLL